MPPCLTSDVIRQYQWLTLPADKTPNRICFVSEQKSTPLQINILLSFLPASFTFNLWTLRKLSFRALPPRPGSKIRKKPARSSSCVIDSTSQPTGARCCSPDYVTSLWPWGMTPPPPPARPMPLSSRPGILRAAFSFETKGRWLKAEAVRLRHRTQDAAVMDSFKRFLTRILPQIL